MASADLLTSLSEGALRFKQGQYGECCRLLRNVDCHKSVYAAMVRQHNLLICRFQELTLTKSAGFLQNVQKETSNIKTELEQLLIQVEGLPTNQQVLTLQLMTGYHIAYLELLQQLQQGRSYFEASLQSLDVILDVCTSVCQTTDSRISKHGTSVSEKGQQLILCLSQMRTECTAASAWQSMKQLMCLTSVCLLHIDKAAACAVLEETTKCGSTIEDSEDPSTLIMMPLVGISHDDKKKGHQPVSSICHYLLGLALYMQQKTEECLRVLEEVSGHLERQAHYLRGQVCFQRGETQEAMKCVQLVRLDTASPGLAACTKNLMGCCLAQEGKKYSAIQHFKEALQTDPSSMMPLYNIALQFRDLRQPEAELESLNLLIMGLDSWDENQERGKVLPPIVELPEPHRPHLSHVLYQVAASCLKLDRFDDAAEAYMRLLALLLQSPQEQVVQMGHEASLPPVSTVFLEAAASLNKAGRYQESSVLCDKILNSSSTPCVKQDANVTTLPDPHNTHYRVLPDVGLLSESQKHPTQEPDSDVIEGMTRKRPRVVSCDGSDVSASVLELSTECVALIYKADSLYMRKSYTEALDCVNRVLLRIQPRVKDDKSEDKVMKQQAKRRKVDHSDGDRESFTDYSSLCGLLHQKKAACHLALQQVSRAAHCARVAKQFTHDPL